MAFAQGVVVMGGYRSCPAVQCGATMTTALTHQPPLFCSTKEPPRRESGTLRAPKHLAKCMQ